MNRLVTVGAFVSSLALGPSCIAASVDTGVISKLYFNGQQIAVQLSGGFPNASSANECPTNNGWAGMLTADPAMKAALIAAKASGQPVRLVISGCEATDWWKVVAIYWDE